MAQDKLTIIAELRDRVSGPLQQTERAIGRATKTVETHGKTAEKAHDRAGKAAAGQAEDTRKASTGIERALAAVGGSADSMARSVSGGTRKAAKGLDALVADAQGASSDIDRYLSDAGERGGTGMVSNLKSAGSKFVSEARSIGDRAGDRIASGIENAVSQIDMPDIGGSAGAAAGGAGFIGATIASVDRDSTSRTVAAANDADPAEMRELLDSAYRNNYGENYGQVAAAGAAIVGTFDIEPGSPEAERLLAGNLTLEKVFGLDAQFLSLGVKVIADADGLDPTKAQDVLAGALQLAAPAARDEVLDNITEYIPNLGATGMSGTGIATAMAQGSQIGGVYGSDKTGDLMKEWQIIAADPSEDQSSAYSELGLDANEINAMIREGRGDEAFQKTASAVAAADPAEQGRLAIGVYGTPVEDLGLANIPQYTELWSEATVEAKRYDGAVQDMMDVTEEGPGAAFGQMLRTAGDSLIAIGDEIAPILTPFFEAMTKVAPYAGDILLIFTGIKAFKWGKGVVEGFGTVATALGKIGTNGNKATGSLGGLAGIMRAHPVLTIATGIYLAADAFSWLYDNVEPVRVAVDALVGVFDRVDAAVKRIGDSIEELVRDKFPMLDEPMNRMETNFADANEGKWKAATDETKFGGNPVFTYVQQNTPLGGIMDDLMPWRNKDEEDEKEPGHALGGFTTGARSYQAGERGREFITSAWATNKVEAAHPGALAAMNATGQLPAGNITLAPTIRIDGAQDPAAVGAQVEAAIERLARKAGRGYMTPSLRGAN